MAVRRSRNQVAQNIYILLEGMVIFTILFIALVVVTNWSAVSNEVAYAVKPKPEETVIITNSEPTVVPVPPTPIDEPAHITIEKIRVDAPIQWNIPPEKTVEALNKGVAHLAGSARPGQIGNIFITGHSSDYIWKRNPYAAVFSLLPKLQIGDAISIHENGKAYIYRVAETKIVNPDEVQVANQTTTPVLTLMTCYPVGTTKQRFVVHATLVSSPEKPVPASDLTGNFTVPEIKFR